MKTLLGACAALAAAAAPAVASDPPCVVERFALAGNAAGYDFLGEAVAFDGETVVAGAFGTGRASPSCYETGAAHVFGLDDAGTQHLQLLPTGLSCGAQFGDSVAVDGDRCVVGAPSGSSGNGMATVYLRTATGWVEEQQLFGSNPYTASYFGTSCDISGDTIVVGGTNFPFAGTQGRIHVFVNDGTTWVEQVRIEGVLNAYLGFGVAIDGDTLASGASVYRRTGTTWTHEAQLPVGGTTVDLDGGTLAFGTPHNNDLGPNAGTAFVLARQGTTWVQQAQLYASDAAANDRFGSDVSVSGDWLVVGARTANAGTGAAYLFKREGSTWSEALRVVPDDAAVVGWYGNSVALSGHRFVVGSPLAFGNAVKSGLAYVYDILEPPATYCVGKTTSAGCVPFLSTSGTPSASAVERFLLRANDAVVGEAGFVLYGAAKANVNFHGGKLCVRLPLRRLLPPAIVAPGAAGACGGRAQRDFNASIQSGADPSLSVGATVFAQWYLRDPANPSGTGDALTDAVRFQICD